ncbi:MAG: hypothetical protein F4093_00415, partial [Gammaproteobacteria bacterium]|nr:hypothetical protein [Gammaproteobacteria bacterium]
MFRHPASSFRKAASVSGNVVRRG